MADENGTKDLVVKEKGGFMEGFKNKANDMLVSYFGDAQKVARFYSAMSMCFAANPKLKDCTAESLSIVFMTCAEVGLYPSNYGGECYVIPYKKEATFQIGYQGLITLAYRAKTKKIDAHIIYENDVFEYQFGLNPVLDHSPDIFSAKRGEPKGAYATAILESDETIFLVMSKSDILKHRDKSPGKDKPSSPWKPKNDPQLWMWKKTVLKQLSKLMPKSPIMQQAVAADIKGDIIDVTPQEDIMSVDEITAYYKRISEQWDADTINEVILMKRPETGTLEKLTIDEAALIEEELMKHKTKDGKTQGELI